VVPHTHWDREWYRTFEEFRYRLVGLLDGLLDLLDAHPEFSHFTLDGQTVVLGDYLEVRPEARARIEKRVREGRLLVGPWYVLPDEWLVSEEALVRNLRLGRRQAEAVGGAMPIGYVPDQFGHVGQLPQIFAGFGFEGAVLWRGVGANVEQSPFWWEAPDGTRCFTIHLPFGYGNGVHLPMQPAALARRLGFELDRLEKASRVPTLLLMNGSDHVRPRSELPRALEAAAAELPETDFEIGTLPGFVRRVRAEAEEPLTVQRGELRSGLRAPLLPGCASARMYLKQADFRNHRLLTRYLEPLAAWVGLLGADSDPGLIDYAWRLTLENHPHDSICGCSIDRVHDEMETRFRRVEEVARTHLDRIAGELATRVRLPEGSGPGFAVWNPNPAGPGLVESELALDLPSGKRGVRAFHLRGAGDRRVAATAEVLEPEQVLARMTLPTSVAEWMLPALDGEIGGLHARQLSWRRDGEEIELDILLGPDSGGLDLDPVRRELTALLADPGITRVRLRARRPPRLRVRFVDDLPGFGLRTYRVAPGPARSGPRLRGEPCEGGGAVIENEHWRVEAGADGTLALVERGSGRRIEDAIRLVSEADRGDEYNFDPVPGGEIVERPDRVRVRLGARSEVEASLIVEARYRVPERLEPGRDRRSHRQAILPVRLEVRLARTLDRVDVSVEVDNTARDHRLRLHARAPFRAERFEVESAFEVVERPIAPEPGSFGSAAPAEFPIGACPQRAFASLVGDGGGLTLANRGLAEVEAVREENGTTSLAVTLLRAVGWLSRDDLALRPGHAGPGLETPGAQVPGRSRAELSLRLHEVPDPARVSEAHGFAHPPLAIPVGTSEGPLADGASLLRIDPADVVITAIEPRPSGQVLVRGFNASGNRQRLQLALPASRADRLEAVDLAERPRSSESAGFSSQGASASLELRPWEIFSVRTGE
jgi:alpha-mannosidase